MLGIALEGGGAKGAYQVGAYIALKKKAYEKNSDYYFKERGEPIKNQKENLRHRSLGEETIFNY